MFTNPPNIQDAFIIFKERISRPKEEFELLTQHQKCLFYQVITGIQQKIPIQEAKGFSNETLLLFKYLNTLIDHNAACKDYLNKDGTINCKHITFSFYAYAKWYEAFKYILQNYFIDQSWNNKNIDSVEDIIYIRNAYCDSCYEEYKKMEKGFNTSNKQNTLLNDPLNYVFLNAANNIEMLRIRYSDNCDIPIENFLIKGQYGHVEEVFLHKRKQLKNLTERFVASIFKEIMDASALLDKIITS